VAYWPRDSIWHKKVALHEKKEREEKMGVGAVEVIILIIFCLVMAVAAVVLALKGAYKVGRPIAKGIAKGARKIAKSSRVAHSPL
jgi:hypothetical protein